MKTLWIIFCLLCVIHEMNGSTILWNNDLTELEERDGFLALRVRRNVTIGEMSAAEKIDLETAVGKMYGVFQSAFGVGDFVRWMPLGEENIHCYLFPVGPSTSPNEIDMEYKVRLMLHTLAEQRDAISALSSDDIAKVKAAATQLDLQGECLLEQASFPLKRVREGCDLLAAEVAKRGGPTDWQWFGPQPRTLSSSDPCKAFCNESVRKRQMIYESTHNMVLANPWSYVEQHMMVVSKDHRETMFQQPVEQILDKYWLFGRIDSVARNRFNAPKTAVLTRVGCRAGQTQNHVHDHVLGYNPTAIQPWMVHWPQELGADPNKSKGMSAEELKALRAVWEKLFSKIRTVTFDIGGVMVEQRNLERAFLQQEFPTASWIEFAPLTAGQIDEETFWQNVGAPDGFMERWKTCYIESNPVRQEMVQLAEQLRKAGLQVACLSNTIASHAEVNSASGLYDLFEPRLLSHEIKQSKPTREAYERLIHETGVRPEEIIFIDDVPRYAEAASTVGIHGIVFKTPQQAEREIRQLLSSE